MTRGYMSRPISPMQPGSLLERCARMQMGDNQAELPPISVRRARRKPPNIWAAIFGSLAAGIVLFMLFLGVVS